MNFKRRAQRLVLELAHGILQQLAVQLVADGRDVSALLGAADIAGAADFEVPHGNLETSPQLGELFNRLEPASGRRRDAALTVEQQIGIGPVLVTTDSSPQLVQIRQAVLIRLVDEDRVDVGDVQAALDDRGRHQDVALLADEAEHRLLQLMLVHLAVGNRDARLGHDRTQLLRNIVNVVDAVMDKVDLTVTVQLAQDGVPNERRIEAGNARLDG